MGQSLVIVESVAKTKTINRILGRDYVVKASVGHIRDLPKRRLGVDIENGFEPEYITVKGKGKTLQELKKVAGKANDIFIATDPDREGEAIAHHIALELKNKNGNIKRVLFNEITETAVKEAIDKPTIIQSEKVEAQKARRVMDRLVGYQVSPLLWKTIYRGLSAGRVQSVALRLLCEREDEFEAFVPEEYWSILAQVRGQKTEPFHAKLIKIDGKDKKIKDESTCQYYVDDIWKKDFVVKNLTTKEVKRNPFAPFTTSTLQQDAARRFGFSGQRIMAIAQQLYEGIELGDDGSVGLITYMRTDSTRVAKEAIMASREYIGTSYGQEYLPDKPRQFQKKGKVQDAHEAIRPTSMKWSPKKIAKYLTSDQLKLYQLIWNRFLASQMAAAVYKNTTIDIEADEYLFRKSGSTIIFRGFLQVYEDMKDKDGNDENGNDEPVPVNLTVGEKLKLLNLEKHQHFTKPPPRFNESTLVKELDQLDIGRPSTYATIISTLLFRKYVDRVDRKLIPTELGRTVNKLLVAKFPDIFNVKFTALMEEELDLIEEGSKTLKSVMTDFYDPFQKAVRQLDEEKSEIKAALQKQTDEKCPDCGGALVEKWGRNGKFIACSNYPDCRFTRNLEEEDNSTEEKCEKCGSEMIVKVGRFGRFLACSSYPNCKNTRPITLGIKCPKPDCGGDISEKQSRRGKIFYGCSNYPECDFATWYKPIKKTCDQCSNPYMEERQTKAKGSFIRCPACKYEIVQENINQEG